MTEAKQKPGPKPKAKPKTLAERHLAVRAGVGAMKREGENKFDKYKFISHDQVKRKINALLVENGLDLEMSVEELTHEMRQSQKGAAMSCYLIKFRVTWIAVDTKESSGAFWYAEGVDRGDKAITKAITYAKKSYLIDKYLIPGTDRDPDEDTVEFRSEPIKEKTKEALKAHAIAKGFNWDKFSKWAEDETGVAVGDMSYKELSSMIDAGSKAKKEASKSF